MSLADLTDLTEAELLKNNGLDILLNPNSCEICTKTGIKVCSTCCMSWYCSSEHQQRNLEVHKLNCKPPIELKTKDVIGRHFVASRNLNEGVMILSEAPAFWGPRADKDCDPSVYCLSCCLRMNKEDYRRCLKCRWPICSPVCEKDPIHSKQECELFSHNQMPFPTIYDTHITYKSLFNIRGLLLKESDPELWSDIQDLDDVAPKLGKISLFPNLSIYKHVLGVPPNFGNEDEWNKVQGVCNVNAFWEDNGSKCANFIFLKGSKFAQSCSPNASWIIKFTTPDYPEPMMIIRTTTKIKKGDIVGISYNSENPKKGTEERQNPGFVCKCPRCIDPKELGSCTSAMKCLQTGCSGFMFQVDPPAEDINNSIWRCDAEGCGNRIPANGIVKIISMMNVGLQDLPITAIENFIQKKLQKVLHPNHWILLEASSRIVLDTGRKEVKELVSQELDRYIWHCRRILEVYDIVIPGLSKHRGLILRALGPPLFCKLDRELTPENRLETLAEALKAYDLLKEAFLCLKDYPSNTPIPPDNFDIRDYVTLLVLNHAKEFIQSLVH